MRPHALSRMSIGLHRWCREHDAPDEARERRDKAASDLSAVIPVLHQRARWTRVGERYFENLKACLALVA